jgi:hypothetical protein
MLITKRSSLSGNTNSREINVTQAQLDNWASGTFIQNAMPHLSPDDREFLMTGITPEEWDKHFNEEEYDINDIVCDECASPKGNICTCKVL